MDLALGHGSFLLIATERKSWRTVPEAEKSDAYCRNLADFKVSATPFSCAAV